MLRVITFKIDEELLEELDQYCREVRVHRSEIIRRAIRYYLYHFSKQYGNRIIARTERLVVYE